MEVLRNRGAAIGHDIAYLGVWLKRSGYKTSSISMALGLSDLHRGKPPLVDRLLGPGPDIAITSKDPSVLNKVNAVSHHDSDLRAHRPVVQSRMHKKRNDTQRRRQGQPMNASTGGRGHPYKR